MQLQSQVRAEGAESAGNERLMFVNELTWPCKTA